MPDVPQSPLNIFIGFDSREPDLSDICAHSIARHTHHPLKFHYLKHRELRKRGWFSRHWQIGCKDGEWIDSLDDARFSTEFSHTRFLVPALSEFRGMALFCDADMIFTSDISKLFALAQSHYAVQCVQHQHTPKVHTQKMDGRLQQQYFRKNWSSFVLWNCGHRANAGLTPERVGSMAGLDMHRFRWLPDHEIGALPATYNYISGVSPRCDKPDVIHYTEGGPWFKECLSVPFADLWERERTHWLDDGQPSYDQPIGQRA